MRSAAERRSPPKRSGPYAPGRPRRSAAPTGKCHQQRRAPGAPAGPNWLVLPPECLSLPASAAIAHNARPMKKLFIKTYGCQMNVYDSARIADLLAPLGYAEADTPDAADMVVLNT